MKTSKKTPRELGRYFFNNSVFLYAPWQICMVEMDNKILIDTFSEWLDSNPSEDEWKDFIEGWAEQNIYFRPIPIEEMRKKIEKEIHLWKRSVERDSNK